ncbi:plastid-lipid-associated protein [Hibiscus syriacus]|uniref:Plastid-lipid-associated protein n=1 Tax=Hibiscus syriacus TaxID=106335 RepID=A0A6A3A7R0_HIBSY|nr:plastid-lipid-associated protein [Hibiscus syriacus]
MESQTNENKESKILSPCSSGRSSASSPEFEFWMVRNPSIPQPYLISADELFVNGVLRPLHLLNNKQPEKSPQTEQNPPASEPSVPDTESEPEPSPLVTSYPTPALSASKRWRDIFKKEKGKSGAKNQQDKDKEKDKKKEFKEKKSQSQSGESQAELNINIWPFSRSRSAGTSASRPRMTASTAGARKVSSAPCTRSNSAGESKSRKWPSSPSRAGVHLGRSSPVWQVRRSGSDVKSFNALARTADKGSGKKEVTEARRYKTGNGSINNCANVNVPMCIGYKRHLNCRIDDNSAAVGGSDVNGRSSGSNLRSGIWYSYRI